LGRDSLSGNTDIQLARKRGKSGLSVYRRENMESQLFWFLDYDVFSLWIPANHVMVLGALEESIELGEERRLRLDVSFVLLSIVHSGSGRGVVGETSLTSRLGSRHIYYIRGCPI
jgi:hypothetical protein